MMPDEARKPVPTGSELVSSFQILSLVGETLRLIHDGADTTATTRALTQLRERFERCEGMLDRLPGGCLTRAEQVREIARLHEELERKRKLVRQYAEHDLVARVLAQKPVAPQKEEMAMEDDGAEEANEEAEDVMIDEEVFADVDGMGKDVGDDVLMGLDI